MTPEDARKMAIRAYDIMAVQLGDSPRGMDASINRMTESILIVAQLGLPDAVIFDCVIRAAQDTILSHKDSQ